jgi:hypothetical protein
VILRSNSYKYFNVKTKCVNWRIKGTVATSVSESSAGDPMSEANNSPCEVLHPYMEICEAGNSCE